MPRRVRYADHPDGFCDVHGDGGPVALVFHGGGWLERSDLSIMTAVCEDLAARGWTAYNAEYRRLGSGNRWPEMSADVRAAAELARPRVTIGHSAGGLLALWAAAEGLTGAVVGQAPTSDLAAAALTAGPLVQELGAPAEASPVLRVPLGVPQLIVHGDDDRMIGVGLSRAYVRAAREAGDRVDYEERPGEGHFEHISPHENAWRVVTDWIEDLR
jgi:acetyl esterase/lipase